MIISALFKAYNVQGSIKNNMMWWVVMLLWGSGGFGSESNCIEGNTYLAQWRKFNTDFIDIVVKL